MYFIRQFRNSINIYIEQSVENKLSKFKEKMEAEFDHKVDAFLKNQKLEEGVKRLRQGQDEGRYEHEMTYAGSLPMFTGQIIMGAEQNIIDVVYDTGSDWLVIPDIDCLTCDGNRHDSSSATPIDTDSSERIYGSARLEGKTYSDIACLNKEQTSCVQNFEYFSFHWQ